MELLQLKYFMMAARHQGITRAAEELHVAQPSVSQAISRLEKELGIPLFDRVGKKVQLNAGGRLFLNAVESIFGQLDQAVTDIEVMKSTSRHPLVVSIWNRSSLCSKILVAFWEKYPYVNLKIVHNGEKSDLDLLVGSYDQPIPSPSEVIFQEEILLAVHRTHALAEYDSIQLIQAKNEGFIMLNGGVPFRTLTESFCRMAGFEPRIIFENDYAETLGRMIQLGLGVGFLPQTTWGAFDASSVKALRIESPICIRTINVAWKEGTELSPSALLFKDFVRQYMKEHYRQSRSDGYSERT